MRRPAAPLPTVARATGNCAAVEASSPLSVTICLSHFGPRIGQTSLQLLFCPNLSLLPSTHSFPLFLGRGCNNLSPHFRWILAVWITSVYEARDDHCARGAYWGWRFGPVLETVSNDASSTSPAARWLGSQSRFHTGVRCVCSLLCHSTNCWSACGCNWGARSHWHTATFHRGGWKASNPNFWYAQHL